MDGQLLSVKAVYLAGPIDLVPSEEAKGWRMKACDLLHKRGIMTFHPTLPYCGFNVDDQDHAKYIDAINRAAIRYSQAVLCNLQILGVGTVREIEYARHWQRPVFVFNWNTPAVALHDVIICKSLEEAVDRISVWRVGSDG